MMYVCYTFHVVLEHANDIESMREECTEELAERIVELEMKLMEREAEVHALLSNEKVKGDFHLYTLKISYSHLILKDFSIFSRRQE